VVGQNGVERETAVTLAQDEAVPIRPIRFVGAHGEYLIVKYAKDLHDRQRRSDVSAPGAQAVDDQRTKILGALVE
jgi:hypothetical protein